MVEPHEETLSPPAVNVSPQEAGPSHPPEPLVPPPARLKCVSVSAWHPDLRGERDGYARLKQPRAPEAVRELERWRKIRARIWIELALPDDPSHWFEGIADPWISMQTPTIDWSDVEDVLAALEILPDAVGEVDHRSDADARLLALLPHLYALGVARVRCEVFDRKDLQQAAGDGPLFFPTVGFEPVEPKDASSRNGADPSRSANSAGFWTIRTCVGVIGDRTVVSIRLPDLLCTGTPGSHPEYRTPLERDLPIPRRFLVGRFPKLSKGPEAVDIAEGIAVHHAATARAVAEEARKALRDVEANAGHLPATGSNGEKSDSGPGDSGSQRADVALRELERISEITHQIDRQLSRELRRLADYGECQHPVGEQAEKRFGFALDEIRSLRTEIATTRAAIVGHIQVQDQTERERFQFIVALLGSAILIPTLVAAIYGANVNVPGENSWTGFRALLLFILASFIVGVLAVNEFWASGWAPKRNWLQKGWIKVVALAVAAASLTSAIITVAS
jgi:hypothetical protein